MKDRAVFVVDDDASVRRALARLLRSTGLRVRTFDCGPAVGLAMRDESEDQPACLILDVRMPGWTGFDLVESLRARQHVVPVIFITGDAGIAIAGRAVKAGAVRLLTKPFDEEDLLGAVRDAMNQVRGVPDGPGTSVG
jgi:two-component system, LuxR family, response regulator FixJ